MTREPNGTPRCRIGKLMPWALALFLMVSLCRQAVAAERYGYDEGRPHLLQRFHPVGGWHPDSGGLCHWWNPECFPRCGGPDDYCRKPLPNVCWPPYPPFYVGGSCRVVTPFPEGDSLGRYRDWEQHPH